MTLPNFLIIGAGRTGTTSLYNYLKQHPDIFMSPVKEPRFFAYVNSSPNYRGSIGNLHLNAYSTNLSEYQKLYSDVENQTAIGEASVDYFYLADAAKNIKKHIPNAKIILILRHPVDRAYSQFWARVSLGIEPLTDFSQAMDQEEERIKANWPPQYHYKHKSFYSKALRRYFSLFDKSQIKIILHEDYHQNPSKTIKEVSDFLGVDSAFSPDISHRYNLPKGMAKNAFLNHFLMRPHVLKSIISPFLPKSLKRYLIKLLTPSSYSKRPPLSKELRKELTAIYKKDILELQDLIKRDLSGWFN